MSFSGYRYSFSNDAQLSRNYTYDATYDQLVYADGTRIARPPHIPSAVLSNVPYQMQMGPLIHPPQALGQYVADYEALPPRQNLSLPSMSSRHRSHDSGISGMLPSPSESSSSSAVTGAGLAWAKSYTESESLPQRRGVLRQTYQTDTGPILNVYDQRSGVRETFQTEPKEAITDPALFEKGVQAYRLLREPPDSDETLFAAFKKSSKPHKFFVEGKVFLILWAEPAGGSAASGSTACTTTNSVEITKGRFGEPVFSKVRRFVVVREGGFHCTALPVMTYGGKGVAKRGVTKSDHAVIFTGKSPPPETSAEKPARGEPGMRPRAIRVDVDHKFEQLDPMSRIDFGKPHTIHHNLKVRSFGKVNRESMLHLMYQFDAVWRRSETSTLPETTAPELPGPNPPPSQHENASGDIWADAYEALVTKGYSPEDARRFLGHRTEDPLTSTDKETQNV